MMLHQLRHSAATLMVAMVAALAALGCADESDPGLGADDGTDDGSSSIDFTDPLAVAQGHASAWGAKSLGDLSDLLAADFQFFPLADDAADFPWITGESWDRATELGIGANMFDPVFVDSSGGGDPARRVDRIEMVQTFRSRRDLDGGVVEVATGAEVFVWFNLTDALHTEAVFVFELRPSGNGRYLIQSVRERELLAPAVGSRVENRSWGSMKSLYRSQ